MPLPPPRDAGQSRRARGYRGAARLRASLIRCAAAGSAAGREARRCGDRIVVTVQVRRGLDRGTPRLQDALRPLWCNGQAAIEVADFEAAVGGGEAQFAAIQHLAVGALENGKEQSALQGRFDRIPVDVEVLRKR